MTNDLLTNIGEEYIFDQQPDGTSHTWLLYDDSTDGLSETSDVSDITTEPTNTNYARQSSTVTTQQLSGDYGYSNDSSLSFDFSDVSSGDTAEETLDTAGDIANFDSSVAGDGGTATDHLLANPAMDNTHATGDVDSIDYSAGALEVKVS